MTRLPGSLDERQTRVDEFARQWPRLPLAVREALAVVREYEAEGAYNPTMLADPVRGFFRQHPGSLDERDTPPEVNPERPPEHVFDAFKADAGGTVPVPSGTEASPSTKETL